jgi:hypothetical protein
MSVSEDDAASSDEIVESRELVPPVNGFHLEPRCRVCRNDVVRKKVNDLLASGSSYAMIVRALGEENATLDGHQITLDSVRNHASWHFPVQNVAKATYREILERRAREAQIDFANGLATALTPMAFYENAFGNWSRPRESSGHEADHGDVDDGLVVVGSGLVGTHATTVLDDPAERALHHPNSGPHVESGAAGEPFDDLNPKGEYTFRPTQQPPGVATVGPDSRMLEKLPRSAASNRCAASRSWIEAAVTTTANSSPETSTAMWRLTPFVRFPPSHPRRDRGTVSAAGTVCESMTAAVGHRSRPARTRSRSRNASWMRRHTPARTQRTKIPYTVDAGGNSTGSCRQAIPPRTTYRIASRIRRRQYFSGLPPRPAALPGGGSSGSSTAHCASVSDEDGYTAH